MNPSSAPPSTVQISNFKFVNAKQKAGFTTPSLRFTLVVTFGEPQLALGIDGCLAKIKKDGELIWSPPLSRIFTGAQIKTAWVNEELYDRVIAALASSEYIAGLQKEGWDENTGVPANQESINV